MRRLQISPPAARGLRLAGLVALAALPVLAAANPWEGAINNLSNAFTGPIGRGLSLVAIVVTGLMFAFGEPGGKKALAGVLFGLSMAIGAVQWLTWLTS